MTLHLTHLDEPDLELTDLVAVGELHLEVVQQTLTLTPPTRTDLTLTSVRTELAVAPSAAAGPPGRDGPAGVSGIRSVAAVDLTPLTVVLVDVDGAHPASSTDPATVHQVAGVVVDGALAGEDIDISTGGLVHVDATLPAGVPLYLSPTGSLTASPDTGAVKLLVGYAPTAHTLVVRLGVPVTRPGVS